MPLYRNRIAQELEERQDEFEEDVRPGVVEEFRDAAERMVSEFTKNGILEALEEYELPSALPTDEFDDNDGLVIRFDESTGWQTHEAVNTWARSQLENVTTISADGSQIDPVSEFQKPAALVQAVWIANNHTTDGDYEEGVETSVLTPTDILFEDPNSGLVMVDDEEVPVSRFEIELQVLEERIREVGEGDPATPPVILFDGPFVLSFAQMYSTAVQERYSEALARVLAASKYHKVPIVGYTAGSKASDIAKMMERAGLVDGQRSVRDYQIVGYFLENWGDRTIVFNTRRDNSLNWLKTQYRGQDYDFSEDLLFTYLKTGQGTQVDRLDIPRWVDDAGLSEHVFDTVRAETGVGRGYPEILQAVDADAVISRRDREEFLRLLQDFSDENDIELRWNNKALSKKRRRR